MRVDGKWHASPLTKSGNKRMEALRRDRAASLRTKYIGVGRLLALQATERAQFVALDRVDARRPALASAYVQASGVELDLVPLQITDLGRTQPMAVRDQVPTCLEASY